MNLGDGESIVGTFDPTKEVATTRQENGAVQWSFRLLLSDGNLGTITGGKRLKNAFLEAVNPMSVKGPVRVKVSASGAARTFARTYKVEVMK